MKKEEKQKLKISVLTIILIVLAVFSLFLTIYFYSDYQNEFKYYQGLLNKESIKLDINYSSLTQDQKLALQGLDSFTQTSDIGRENMYLSYMHSAYAKYSEMRLAVIIFIFLSILSWKLDRVKHKR